ncbi:MAG: hypothetical protein KKF56_01815 [Nanoarchaeota archaeon]|nr:hypothetical protein [Nanoarchaeota archaeon]
MIKLLREIAPAIGGLALVATIVGVIVGKPMIENHNRRENDKTIKEVRSHIAGSDRVISVEESRRFLDAIGYTGVIHENDSIYFRHNGPRIDVVVGYDVENNGMPLIGSSAKSGRVVSTLTRDELRYHMAQSGISN